MKEIKKSRKITIKKGIILRIHKMPPPIVWWVTGSVVVGAAFRYGPKLF